MRSHEPTPKFNEQTTRRAESKQGDGPVIIEGSKLSPEVNRHCPRMTPRADVSMPQAWVGHDSFVHKL